MVRPRVLRLTTVIPVLGVACALAFGPTLMQHQVTPALATSSLAFGSTTVVDDQRIAGEPDVKVCGPGIGPSSFDNCGQDNPYASAPYGFSTTASFVWRSEDQGKTFKLVPSNNTLGKPDACPGGGDTDLGVSPGTTQSQDYLTFIDLQGLTNFSAGVSTNGGQSFLCNPASTAATAVDRQWFGFEDPAGGNVPGGLDNGANSSFVYLDYDIAAGSTACPTGQANASGNLFVVQRSTDGGKTYSPATVVDCNDGIAGNMQVKEVDDHVFAIHTGYSPESVASSAAPADSIVVNRSTNRGTTWTRTVVFQPTRGTDCPVECTVGQDFAVLANDNGGGLYAVWSQAPVSPLTGAITGPSHIYYSYSAPASDGQAWTPERRVDLGTTNVNLFPWVAAGKPGALDIVWYGTTKSPYVSSYDSGSQTTNWYPYITQSLNANTSSPTFSAPIPVSQHPNHNGGICTMGIGCTTGGDRSLADFFQVTINKEGGADVIWTDTSNNGSNGSNQGGLIDEARQVSGTTLYGTTLSGTAPVCTTVSTTPCQSDQTGDAKYEANGVMFYNVPKLDITGSSLNLYPSDPRKLDVRMNIAGLPSLPALRDTGMGPADRVVDYLTSWNYHVPGAGQLQYDSTGNIYYAYLEVNLVTGAVTAYDGNTCSIGTTHPKYLVYPGQHAISYKVNTTAKTIDLYPPLTDVGLKYPVAANTMLYSVTAHTVGQAGPAGPYTCSTRDPNGTNQDPTGQIFNVYDKSPAYTARLP